MTRRLMQPVVATDKDLRTLIYNAIKSEGPRCSLNHIDVSQVTDMAHLFSSRSFAGDISRWSTKNVTTMKDMFKGSRFNGNITEWNVSRVTDMRGMFQDSHFNKDISRWPVGAVQHFDDMFTSGRFSGDISRWSIAPSASTERMIPRLFTGVVPCAFSPVQWQRAFTGGANHQAHYFKSAPFVAGMTWWLHLADEQSFSDAVPKELHRWLRGAQELGRQLRMPRLDLACLLALGYPMSPDNRALLHKQFQEHYPVGSSMVDLVRPEGKLDYEAWLFGVPDEAARRIHWVMSAAQPAVPSPPPDMLDLPSLD